MSGAAQPLIRLATAKPILKALDAVYEDADDILTRLGLSRASFDDTETYVHAIVMYQFFEDAAVATSDSSFLAKIGAHLARSNWPPLVAAAKDATTLSAFLTSIVIIATDHSSSTEHHLDVAGKSAFVFGRRYFETPFVPAQIDAFFAALFTSIIKRAAIQSWKSNDVLITVSDPKALPEGFLGVKPLKGDNLGHRIAFPAVWLKLPFSSEDYFRAPADPSGEMSPPKSASDSVREALRPHIGVRPINNRSAAQICGYSDQQLSRILKKEGTSLGRIISELKRDRAVDLLSEEGASVTKVAAMLGYSDGTSFAHAFRGWTGMTPSQVKNSRGS